VISYKISMRIVCLKCGDEEIFQTDIFHLMSDAIGQIKLLKKQAIEDGWQLKSKKNAICPICLGSKKRKPVKYESISVRNRRENELLTEEIEAMAQEKKE